MPPGLMRLVSIVGLLLLVVAYVLNQKKVWRPTSTVYLGCNAVGSGLLTVYSAWIGEWVFVALEGFWCVMSVLPLLRRR